MISRVIGSRQPLVASITFSRHDETFANRFVTIFLWMITRLHVTTYAQELHHTPTPSLSPSTYFPIVASTVIGSTDTSLNDEYQNVIVGFASTTSISPTTSKSSTIFQLLGLGDSGPAGYNYDFGAATKHSYQLANAVSMVLPKSLDLTQISQHPNITYIEPDEPMYIQEWGGSFQSYDPRTCHYRHRRSLQQRPRSNSKLNSSRLDNASLSHEANRALQDSEIGDTVFPGVETTPWGVTAIQGSDTSIPAPDSTAGCFRICVVDSGLLQTHPDIVRIRWTNLF
jgi:hypothetical protein